MKNKMNELQLGLTKKQLREFAKLNFNAGRDKGYNEGCAGHKLKKELNELQEATAL